ncbi:hypothetical protein ACFL2V_00305 [Pseudomonadota bacterium]
MPTILPRHQLYIAAALATLMITTRGHHFASLEHLPSASWAIFFLAGFYLRPAWAFPGFLALAGFLDYAAITWGGVSSFCVSPAYGMLLPAYGSLWLAGRWYANHYRFEWRTLTPFSGAMLGGFTICQLLSSGSFYFFSGRFTDTTLAEFGSRLVKYAPGSLQTLMFYIAIAAVMHVLFVLAYNAAAKRNTTTG